MPRGHPVLVDSPCVDPPNSLGNAGLNDLPLTPTGWFKQPFASHRSESLVVGNSASSFVVAHGQVCSLVGRCCWHEKTYNCASPQLCLLNHSNPLSIFPKSFQSQLSCFYFLFCGVALCKNLRAASQALTFQVPRATPRHLIS